MNKKNGISIITIVLIFLISSASFLHSKDVKIIWKDEFFERINLECNSSYYPLNEKFVNKSNFLQAKRKSGDGRSVILLESEVPHRPCILIFKILSYPEFWRVLTDKWRVLTDKLSKIFNLKDFIPRIIDYLMLSILYETYFHRTKSKLQDKSNLTQDDYTQALKLLKDMIGCSTTFGYLKLTKFLNLVGNKLYEAGSGWYEFLELDNPFA